MHVPQNVLIMSTQTHGQPTLSVSIPVADVLVVKAVGVAEDPALTARQQQEIHAGDQKGAR